MNAKAALASLSLSLILTPLFFLPLTTDFFGFNKLMLWLIFTAIALITWLAHSVLTKTVRLTLSPMLLPLIIFAAVAAVSTYVNRDFNPDSFISKTAFYLTMPVWYLLFTSLISGSDQVRRVLNWLIGVGVTLSLWGVLSVLGIFTSLNFPEWLSTRSFSPTGSLLNLVVLLLMILPLSLVLAFKTSLGPKKLKYFLSSGLIISALILTGYQILPGKELSAVLLPKIAGWSIAIDTFKSAVFFGSGPGNFINQFTRFRPVSLNLSNYWNIAFTASANEYFQVMTTLGLAGLLALALIIWSFIKLSRRAPGTRITALQLAVNSAITVTFILGLIVPFSLLTWMLLVGLLGLSVGLNKSKDVTKVKDVLVTINTVNLVEPYTPSPEPHQGLTSGVLPLVLAIPSILVLILGGLNLGKIYAADFNFRNSLVAASQNRGIDTYNLQIEAIRLAPSLDRYRVSYSNTNLALANALAQQGDLTDQDRQNIATLIQQAISEARLATQINPNKASNWSNLGNLYRQLINFADGADNFAAAAYVKAIQLDPTNPRLRVELGGLYYSLSQYDQAVERFRQATQLKPDFANGYYNLSYAFQQQQKWLEAYQAMEQVIDILPPDSDDAARARQELTDLEAKLPINQAETPAPTETEELTPPASPPAAPQDFPLIELNSPEPTPLPEN